jgi:CheY-like chemotaxis protein
MKSILIVDSDPVMRSTFVGLLNSQGGFLDIQSANNGKMALDIIARQQIHLVITGLFMTEMDGFELVTQLGLRHPEIRVIVMTNSASPMFRAKIKQMHTAVHFEQTIDISVLTKRIFTELQIDYGGQVRGISLPSFLQMIELEGRTCTLQITAKAKTGYLYISNGALIAARLESIVGKQAALLILSWQNVLIDIDYAPKDFQKEITTPLMGLLLESGRIVDEKMSQRPNQRKHDRFECLVAVDYDINDWTYQCFLRDISLGGAYIETAQSIAVGQKIILTLSSPEFSPGCAINALVVRRDKKGIGVTFEQLSLQQKKVVQALAAANSPLTAEIDPNVASIGQPL